jgi:hypothetical protein
MLRLLTAEVSAILITVVARSCTLLAVCRRRIVLLIVSVSIHFLLRSLCRDVGVVGCLSMAEWSPAHPSGTVVWLLALTLSAAGAEAAFQCQQSVLLLVEGREHT